MLTIKNFFKNLPLVKKSYLLEFLGFIILIPTIFILSGIITFVIQPSVLYFGLSNKEIQFIQTYSILGTTLLFLIFFTLKNTITQFISKEYFSINFFNLKIKRNNNFAIFLGLLIKNIFYFSGMFLLNFFITMIFNTKPLEWLILDIKENWFYNKGYNNV